MKRTLFISTAVLMMFGGAAIAAPAEGGRTLSEDECKAMWATMKLDDSGKLSTADAEKYIIDVNKLNDDGDDTIESGEFMKACSDGMIKSTGVTKDATSGKQPAPEHTSDRTPGQQTDTPDEQVDTVDGETSDRSARDN